MLDIIGYLWHPYRIPPPSPALPLFKEHDMALTKSDIAAKIQEIGFTNKAAFDTVESLLEIIKRTLEGEEDVLISGFGKFCVKEKRPRRGRNPATGSDMELWGRRVVTFKCSGKLGEMVKDTR
jgi:integration host factor subunit alpha